MFQTVDLHCNGRCSQAVAPRSEQLYNHWLCTDVGFAGKGIKQVGKGFKDEAGVG